MWLLLAFLSAALLGFYDAFKKESLRDNAVLPVLFLNTLFSSLIFLPFILISAWSDSLDGTIFHVPAAGWEVHKYVLLKSVIVLSSWTFGYFGMKHLPLTIVGPINATRPVMVLVGALLVFGERLNLYQWAGVLMAVISFFMLSRSGKKEGIDFKHNRYIFYVVLAAVTGAISGLYDKYLMAPVSDGGLGTGPHGGAVVVQHLPALHDGSRDCPAVASQTEDDHPVPLGLVHHPHLHLPVGSRLRLLLLPESGRCHDFHRVDGAARQCGGLLPVRCALLP